MRARVRATWLSTDEVNHLQPCSSKLPSGSSTATVSLSETSLPPVRSVIHWPLVQSWRGSRLVRRGTTRCLSGSSACSSSVRAAPSVMASGQE